MRMRISGLFILLGVAVVVVCAALPGSPAGGKPTSVNVSAIVHDTDSTGGQLLLKSDDFNGSGQAAYGAALNANVASYIFSDGRYFLRLYGQSLRTLYLTPNNPINGSQPIAPPPGFYWQNVELAVACYDQNLNLVPFGNVVTSSSNCKMIVDFGYNGTEYKIVMGPTGNLPAPGPATGLVNVACNSVGSGQCVNWTVTPNTSAGSSNPATVADLYVYTNSHQTPLVIVGQYYLTFRIDITNP